MKIFIFKGSFRERGSDGFFWIKKVVIKANSKEDASIRFISKYQSRTVPFIKFKENGTWIAC